MKEQSKAAVKTVFSPKSNQSNRYQSSTAREKRKRNSTNVRDIHRSKSNENKLRRTAGQDRVERNANKQMRWETDTR
jgi:hypothetical protein